jgi:F-type H+-transporting ATPase subunit a
MEHQLWFTAILNKLVGGVVTALLTQLASLHGLEWVRPADPAHPIPNYVAMEILVILIVIVAGLLLRARLSVETPGKFQHLMEVVVQFVQSTADEIIGHEGRRYVPMLGTLFLFVAICNLVGLIPTLATPTAQIQVTLGSAVAAFLYYNFHGFRQHGVIGYMKHLCGPMMAIAILMFPIELISNVGRLLSLSVRLYANMLVGGILEKVFGGMVPILVPVIFMALHLFVSLLQAYIFMLLPAIYISMAVSEEH